MSSSNALQVHAANGYVTDSMEAEFAVHEIGFGICLVIHDAQVQTTAIAHVLMPDSHSNPTFAQSHPYAYSDTAVDHLIQSLHRISSQYADGEAWKEALKRFKVYLVGGSEITPALSTPNESAPFELNLGRIVAAKIRDSLKAVGLQAAFEALGGSGMRNLSVRNSTGKIIIQEAGQPEKTLLAPTTSTT